MKIKKLISSLLVVALVLSMTACVRTGNPPDGDPDATTDQTQQNDLMVDIPTNFMLKPEKFDVGVIAEIPQFSSVDIDERGFWKGLVARDHLEMFKFSGLEIPAEAYAVSDEDIDRRISATEIPQWMGGFPEPDYPEKYFIFDRAIKDGDRVNIDYTGYIRDGEGEWEAFDRGSTEGEGDFVTAGTDQFIDDFLFQIIGMNPGDEDDIFVKFPDNYDPPEMAGKEAKFEVRINHIVDNRQYWYDEFSNDEDYKRYKTRVYIEDVFFVDEVVATVPEFFIDTIVKAFVIFHSQMAMYEGYAWEFYISDILEIEGGWDGFLEEMREDAVETAKLRLIHQAIAEEKELNYSTEDVKEFLDELGLDLDEAIEDYGMPFLKQVAMHDFILNYMVDNAVYL
jgi:trigger factor